MGKGDQRSGRGKIHRGTFGKRRPKTKKHTKPQPGTTPGAASQKASSAS